MNAKNLMISVESHSADYAEVLDEAHLPYQVYKTSRRWIFRTEFLPEPIAETLAVFLERSILPEMLLDHLDSEYQDLSEDDRLSIFEDNLNAFERESFTRGTQAMILPDLKERSGFSVDGWMTFRGRQLFTKLIAEMARQGLRTIRLQRAYEQFQTLRQRSLDYLVIEGEGDRLTVRDPRGSELFREYLDGYLDRRLEITREDLVLGLIWMLQPQRLELVGVHPGFRRKVEELLSKQKSGLKRETGNMSPWCQAEH